MFCLWQAVLKLGKVHEVDAAQPSELQIKKIAPNKEKICKSSIK
jgi:hypothetical protein